MSIDEKRLKADIQTYLRGEDPLGVELATAPQLEEWEIAITRSPGDGAYRMVLMGVVTGHPTIQDGQRIKATSPVVWLDRAHRWARTCRGCTCSAISRWRRRQTMTPRKTDDPIGDRLRAIAETEDTWLLQRDPGETDDEYADRCSVLGCAPDGTITPKRWRLSGDRE